MKKQLLFAALCLFSAGAFAQGVWVPQNTGFVPVSSGVNQVCAVDANVVWITAYDGSGGSANRRDFSRTIDGGANWVAGTVSAPTSHNWSMLHAIDANTCWAMFYNATAGNRGGIWKTTDGGATWAQQGATTLFLNSASFANVVYFWNANEGMCMGDPVGGEYEIYTTVDGGATWTQVPGANIPNPLNASEYGIVGHYAVMGDTIWFDTNNGRIYRSVDKGYNWTVSSTGLTIPTSAGFDMVFYNNLNGLFRVYNAGVNTMVVTSDGGDTWTSASVTGNFFGSDVKYVPGTASRLVSTGAATGFTGSSYSDDGGLTWIDYETGTQRTALGVVDSVTMWAGGFTTSPTSGGIYKWTIITPVACNDPSISPGVTSASVNQLCQGDTLVVTSTGVLAPTVGPYAGVSWAISLADITGSPDPTLETSYRVGYNFNNPAPANSTRMFVHDLTLINGTTLPFGTYWWTPVVFGNAAGGVANPIFLHELNLDPLCTYTGTSVRVDVLDPNDPACITGVNEVISSNLGVYSFYRKDNMINVIVKAPVAGNANLEIMDMAGRIVVSRNLEIAAGTNFELINADLLATGTYVIKVGMKGLTAVNKLVKM